MSKIAPISMCIIVKNEPLLEKCILSFRDYVEELVIVDTGSTDGTTIEIAKKYADIFESYTDCNNPETGLIEDFSKAREYSFSLATKQHVMWLDSDDIIVGAENLLELTNAKATDTNAEAIAFMFPYEYSYNELGQCTCLHYRERLVSDKTKFHWVNPVHEVLIPNENAKTVFVTNDNVVYKHMRQYSDKPLESGRNLRILRNYFEKVKDSDPRQMYYLGLECNNNGLVDEAIEHLSKYVDVSGWDDERAMACLKLIDIYMARGEYDKGLKWAFKTVALKETWGEGYFALGKIFYFLAQNNSPEEIRHWERCAYFSNLGLNLPITKTLLFINPLDRNYDIHRFFNIALNKLGDVAGALNSVNTALKSKPDDMDLLTNKKIYETWIVKNAITQGINNLKVLEDIDQSTADLIIAIINKQVNISNTMQPPNDEQKKNLDPLRLL